MLLNRTFLSVVFLLVIFASCHTTYVAERKETKQYVFSDTSNTASDTAFLKLILPFRLHLDSLLGQTLIVSNQPIEKKNPEGLLGDLVADACINNLLFVSSKEKIPTLDCAILNSGGLRGSLPKGPITSKHVYELMPFENELVVIDADSALLMTWLSEIAKHGGAPVSGIRMKIQNLKPVQITVHGASLQSGKNYHIVTSDYLANGGDNLSFLKKVHRLDLNIKVRDAIIHYLEDQQHLHDTLTLQLDGRIQNVE